MDLLIIISKRLYYIKTISPPRLIVLILVIISLYIIFLIKSGYLYGVYTSGTCSKKVKDLKRYTLFLMKLILVQA